MDPEHRPERRFVQLSRDMVLYGFMSGLSRMTGFLLLPLFTRCFTTGEYGVVEMVTTLTNLVTTFVSLSLPSALARYFFDHESDHTEVGRLVSTLLVFVGLAGMVTLIAGAAFSGAIAGLILKNADHGPLIILGFLSACLSATSGMLKMALRMQRKIVRLNLISLFHSLAFAGLAVYLVFGRSAGLVGLLSATAAAEGFQLVMALGWTRGSLTRSLSLDHLKRSLRYSLPLFPAVLVSWVNNQADRLILLAFLGLSGVGIFGAAAKIGMVVNLFCTVFRMAWSPYAMSTIRAPAEERNLFYRRALNYFACGFIPVALSLTAAAPEIFRLLVPEAFYEGYVIVPWVTGAVILHASGSITNIGILISERTYANSIAAWIGAGANLLLALLLIPLMGIRGAALGAFAAELIFTGLLWFYSIRLSSVRFDARGLAAVLAVYIVSSVAFLWVAEAVQSSLQSMAVRGLLLVASLTAVAGLTLDKQARRSIRFAVIRLAGRPQRAG